MPGNLDKPRSVCYTGNTIPARSVCRLKGNKTVEHTELFRRALPVSFPLTDDARASALREGVRQYGFHAALTLTARPACAKLRIAGRHVFRVYINRRIVLNGPARTAHGYARVDELDVTAFLHHGVNHLAVEMLVYGDVYNKYSNDCTLEPDGFLLCELEADGQVLTATGGADWNACRIAARVANASRISHSREASEIYTLEPGWDGWIMGEADGTNGFCRTAPASAPRLLPHTAATITPTVRRFSRVCGYGTCGIDHEAQLPRLFFEDNPGYYPTGYYASLPEYPLEDCRRTRERSDAGIRLTGTEDGLTLTGTEDSYILLEGECNTTGFPFARFTCEKPGTVDIVRSEILTPDGDFAYNHNTVTRLHVPAGTWNFTAMEAGVARWLKLYFRGTGTVTLHAAGMLVHEYPDAHRASFLCSDGDVNRLYDAAKRTLLCNTQDIFMDCPDRERGGWLCDSLWTARAAAMLLGDTRVEREFLETFLLTPADGMFRGFFPETYPGSKADYAAMTGITTWSFWLTCELCEYVRRTGDTALRDRFVDRVAAFVDGSRSFLGQSGLLERLPWLFIDWSVSNYGEYQTPISVPANALYAYTLAALGGLYTRSDWCAEGERMRGILRTAVLDGRLPETVRTIPDSLERHPDGRLRGRGRCSETGIATCLWADLFAPGELPALDAAFRDCMGFSPRFAPDPEIGRSQLFIGLCIRLDALARRGCYDRLYGELNALYLPQLREGPGTLWESVCMENSSRCHGFTSHAGVHLVRDVLGLGEPDGLDRTLTVAPHPCGLRWARGTLELPEGVAAVSWRYDGDGFSMSCQIPDGYEVRICPPREVGMLEPGRVHITVNGREIR